MPAEFLVLSFSMQGDKIRRRNDWSNWLLPPNSPSASNVEPPGTLNFDNLAARIRVVGIEGSAQQTGSRLPQGDAHHEVLSRSSSEEFPSH